MMADRRRVTQNPRLWITAALALVATVIAAGPVPAAGPATAPAETAGEAPVRIVALGTSLTAGYGLAQDAGFVPRLEAALRERGFNVRIENAGVSGDTSAGGLARLDWSIGPDTEAVIVELGSNDALRGLDPARTRANLAAILDRLTARGLPVLLAGMLAPPNLGEDYGREFAALYPQLAETYGVLFYPFFLDGVAAQPALNQPDGIHPNEDGVAEIVRRITPYAARLVEEAQARRRDGKAAAH